MESLEKQLAAKTLCGKSEPSDCPKFIERVFDQMLKVYYGMTSNPMFSRREQAMVVATGEQLMKLEDRINELEREYLLLKEAKPAVPKQDALKRGPGRPPKVNTEVGA